MCPIRFVAFPSYERAEILRETIVEVGESRVFRFEIDPMRRFELYGCNGQMLLEAGEFIVSVGGRKTDF